ncbi:hypothetical protein [uncultured Serinicoccus sp.]|uniref:hypothetical protein n=1 Tax=uncultured Serinicoccus sp. TaxID=735514 RepID=UPI002626A593|nr:hypothetical protein [uncultured Serinicoccus sp.]
MHGAATTLEPVREGTLGWLGWQDRVLAAEIVPPPRWDENPPDMDAIRGEVGREHDDASALHDRASANIAYFGAAYTRGFAAVVIPLVLVAALVLWTQITGSGVPTRDELATPESLDIGPVTGVLVFLVLAAPWTGAVAWRARARLAATKRVGLILRGLLLWTLALVLAPFTFGLSFVVVPVAVGAFVLLARPKVVLAHDPTPRKDPLPLHRLYRESRDQQRTAAKVVRGSERRVRQLHAQATRDYESRLSDFRARKDAWSPFEVLPLPERQDVLVIGGSAVERGDLLHHLGAAVEQDGDTFWVLDLEGRSASSRLLLEARRHGRDVRVLHAGDEAALSQLLDDLDHIRAGRRSLLVDVLSSGIAYDAQGRVSSRSREVRDTLRRLTGVLREQHDAVRAADLHQAMQVLLGRGQQTQSSTTDDFTLGTAPEVATHEALSSASVHAVREAFTQQDRQQFHAAWDDVRLKLESLLPEDDSPTSGERWDPTASLGVSVVDLHLHDADRELRTAVLASMHLELLRTVPDVRPRALAVMGAEALPVELLRQLSEVCASLDVQLLLFFGELVPEVQSLARGRRVVAAFGGHGATAAEELADIFGKEWIDRVQAYQTSWSESEAQNRSETSGRSFSQTGSDQTGGQSGSSAGGWTSGSTWGRSSSQSRGTESSRTDGETTTQQRGGSETRQVQYERRVTGQHLSALPPYTLLVKRGDTVHTADVKADLALPPQLLSRMAQARAVSAEAPAELPGHLPDSRVASEQQADRMQPS